MDSRDYLGFVPTLRPTEGLWTKKGRGLPSRTAVPVALATTPLEPLFLPALSPPIPALEPKVAGPPGGSAHLRPLASSAPGRGGPCRVDMQWGASQEGGFQGLPVAGTQLRTAPTPKTQRLALTIGLPPGGEGLPRARSLGFQAPG